METKQSAFAVPGNESAVPKASKVIPDHKPETPSWLPDGEAPLAPRTNLDGPPRSFLPDDAGQPVWTTTEMREELQPDYNAIQRLWMWASDNATAIIFGAVAVFIASSTMDKF